MIISKQIKTRGFTIVELLIVIVIIAILAAITIVSYNGIQARARSSSALSTATMVSKKAESYNFLNGSYPTYCRFATNTTDAAAGTPSGIGAAGCTAGATAVQPEPKLDNPNIIRSTAPTNETSVLYKQCTSPANTAQVQYYDAMTTGIKYLGLGGASSVAACT